jgi:hypothetical protein
MQTLCYLIRMNLIRCFLMINKFREFAVIRKCEDRPLQNWYSIFLVLLLSDIPAFLLLLEFVKKVRSIEYDHICKNK